MTGLSFVHRRRVSGGRASLSCAGDARPVDARLFPAKATRVRWTRVPFWPRGCVSGGRAFLARHGGTRPVGAWLLRFATMRRSRVQHGRSGRGDCVCGASVLRSLVRGWRGVGPIELDMWLAVGSPATRVAPGLPPRRGPRSQMQEDLQASGVAVYRGCRMGTASTVSNGCADFAALPHASLLSPRL